jgi:hypothetical protein
LDKPLHVIYTVSKLAYRISVILIANERVKKKFFLVDNFDFVEGMEYHTKAEGDIPSHAVADASCALKLPWFSRQIFTK